MTRKALGWYDLDASKQTKVMACVDAIENAACELIALGQSGRFVEDALDNALRAAAEEMAEIENEQGEA